MGMSCHQFSTEPFTWTKDELFWIGATGTNINWNIHQHTQLFFEEMSSENVLYLLKIASILFVPQWINSLRLSGKLTIIGSDNGLSPGQCQAIIWINAVIFLIGPLGTNSIKILIEVLTTLTKICLKILFVKWCPFRLGPNVLSPKQSFWNAVDNSC